MFNALVTFSKTMGNNPNIEWEIKKINYSIYLMEDFVVNFLNVILSMAT